MMSDWLGQLPQHERRRLEHLDGVDVDALARRRVEGEPLQYLEGTAAFLDFEVDVSPTVLIPRPETEGLFEKVLELDVRPARIVDLGTGSGVLALALARWASSADVYAVDLSASAIETAVHNADKLGVSVTWLQGDLFDALPSRLKGSFDLIVSNPPYVAAHEWDSLPMDVRHEPAIALIGGVEGTEVIERIVGGAGEWIADGGWMVLEIGETQGEAVAEMCERLGPVRIASDLAGRDRYAIVGPVGGPDG